METLTSPTRRDTQSNRSRSTSDAAPPPHTADLHGGGSAGGKNNQTIKVAIVEDNDSVRAGLAAMIRMSPDLVLAGLFPDAESAFRDIDAFAPDVILMDIHLPGQSGIECVREVKQRLAQTQVIMLTIEENSQRVFESLEAGASGYLVKNTPPERILEAIRDVHRGGSPMSSHIARALVQRFNQQGLSPRMDENLTQREEEILRYVSQGYRAKEIGELLSISPYTVQTHIRNIYEKLHVRSRAQAIAKLTRFGGPSPR